MLAASLRLLIAGWIVVTLARASRAAVTHRRVMTAVWRRIRLRHVLGAAGLVVVVATVATVLMSQVPGLDLGFGSLLGTTGNAVFTPLEEAVAHAGPPPAAGPDWTLIGVATAFLLPLALLLPWLAFVEEEVFRAGLEDASVWQEARAALVFGLAHLVMLVPVGAALAVGAAGAVYGRIYRASYHRSDGTGAPPAVLRSYRPTRRAMRAADRARTPAGVLARAGVTMLEDRTPERRQATAVLESTVWHTTFNTMVVAIVWATIVWSAF